MAAFSFTAASISHLATGAASPYKVLRRNIPCGVARFDA